MDHSSKVTVGSSRHFPRIVNDGDSLVSVRGKFSVHKSKYRVRSGVEECRVLLVLKPTVGCDRRGTLPCCVTGIEVA